MTDYNPNSIWTSKKKKYDPLPESRKASSASTKPFGRSKEGDIGAFSHGKKNGHGLLWFFVICAAFVAGAAFYFFFLRPTPGPSVSISFVKPDQVFIGDPFTISVLIANNSQSVIKNATLEFMIPDGFSFVGQSSDTRAMPEPIGDISSGGVPPQQDFQLIATGNQNSVGSITARLVYGTDTTGKTQFESDSSANIITGTSAVGLDFTIPQNVFTGQNFNVAIGYHNNTPHDINNVILSVQYPSGFVFSTSSIAPISASANGGSWNLGTTTANAGGSIIITGNIANQTTGAYPFAATSTSDVSGNGYFLGAQTSNVVVAPSPLSLSVSLNNTSTYIANAGDQLNYVISYTNNSSIAFQKITIQAVLKGDMYDLSSLQSDGVLSSANNANTVTWSQATNPELASLAPGQSGSVKIQLGVKGSFPTNGINENLNLQTQIQSPTVPPDTSANFTVGTVNFTSKVRGEVAVVATGYRNDTSLGIKNTGPYPPVVDKPSQYTIHWNVTNYSTEITSTVVSAYLQSGSVFTGQVKSNISAQPTYDAATGLVTWDIGNLPPGTGVNTAPAEAVFQITNTPAVNELYQVLTLMGQTNLSADDMFTGSTLQVSANQVTTFLPNDPTTSNQNGQVTQ